jgi:hypothetical protein
MSSEDLAALQHARKTLAAQQEVESLLAEILDDKPPKNWRELAKGALSE